MRTLNIRLLLMLLAGVVVFGGIFHGIHLYQSSKLGDAFLRAAERAKAEEDYSGAIQNIQKYIVLKPNDPEALAELGLLLSTYGNAKQAFFTLERALRRDETRTDVRRELVSVAVKVGRYSDAQTHLSDYLLKESPKDGELLLLLARCQFASGEYSKAANSLDSAIENAPSLLEAYHLQVQILRGPLEKRSAALDVLDQMVEANPASIEAYVTRGEYLLQHKNEPEVLAAYSDVGNEEDGTLGYEPAVISQAASDSQKALELDSESLGANLLAARCAQAEKRFDEANGYLTKAMQLFPNFPITYTILAELEIQQDDTEGAIEWLNKGINVVDEKSDLLWNLANILIDQGKIDQANDAINQLANTEHPKSAVNFLRARLAVSKGEWLAAVRQLEPLRPALTQWPDLAKQVEFQLGTCYRQLGKTDLQLTAFRRAATIDPFWLPARLGVAQGLLALGRIDEAYQEFEYAVRLPGATTLVLLDLARLNILRNLQRNPDQRNWEASEQILSSIEQGTPNSIAVPILRAEMLVAKGETQNAEQVLMEAKNTHPDEADLWMTLVALALRRNELSKAESILDDAKQQLGDGPALRLAEGRLAALSDKETAGDKLRTLADNVNDFDPSEVLLLTRGLANLALAISDFELAEELCVELSKLDPNNLSVQLLLFDLALLGDRKSILEEALGSIKRIEGDGPLWRYGEAVRLTIEGRGEDGDANALATAEIHLAEARISRPSWSRIPLLMAEIDDMQDDTDNAVRHYLEAIELGERNPKAISRLVSLLYKQKRYVEADQVIRRLQEQKSPFSGDMVRMAADISLRLDDFDRAIEIAQEAAENSSEMRDHLWLAQVLGVLGRDEESEAKFRYAIELAPDTPDVWIGYVGFLARSGQEAKAQQVIAEAEKRLPPDQVALTLASCFESLKQLESAEQQYKEAIGESPSDIQVLRRIAGFYLSQGNAAAALPYLEKIIAQSDQANDDDLVWSRRNLAILVGTKGDRLGFERAMSLLDTNLDYDSKSLADMRAKAIILANRGESKERTLAIQLLEQVARQQSEPSESDIFLLANLHISESEYLAKIKHQPADAALEWRKARRHMQGLLAANPNEARYVQTYVDALLRQGENHEAGLWFDQLKSISSSEITLLGLQVRVLIANERFEDVIQVLEDKTQHLSKDGSQDVVATISLGQLLEVAGTRLEKLEKSEEATKLFNQSEKLYASVIDSEKSDPLVLAGFLARRQRFDEAIQAATKELSQATPEQIANFAVNISQQGKDLNNLEQFLNQGLSEHKNAAPILSVLADVHIGQGRYSEAEKDYRKMLADNPNNVVVLNNLAFLLALREQNPVDAKQFIEKAIDLAGPRAALLDTRGVVLSAIGEHLNAVADLQKAVAENPSANRLFHLAVALQRAGNKKAAADVLLKAKERGLTPEDFSPLEQDLLRKLESTL